MWVEVLQTMSNSIQAVHAVNAYASANQTANQPPKPPAAASTPHDKVTISSAAQQALANNAKAASSGDSDHDGH
jgi:hypothetical protein